MLQSLRRKIRNSLLDRWQVPYSAVSGVSPSLYRRFRHSGPITLIDIGAHTAWFTTGLRGICPIKDALLIEPIEPLARKLASDPAFAGYRIADCAVTDFDGEIEMKIFPERTDMSSTLELDESVDGLAEIARTTATSVSRPARKLDTAAAGFAMSGIDLIKIDVQGLEHLVIKGGAETLSRTRAVFTEVSFRPHYLGSSVFSDVYQLLSAHGFMMIDLEPGFKSKSGELLEADALFVKAADRHKER
jgi:FkbM family methyltransferase